MSGLVNCKTCKKEIAKSAKTCPHCGVDMPGMNVGKGCLGIIVFSVLIGLVISFFADKNIETTSAKTTTEEAFNVSDTTEPINNIDFSLTIEEYIKRYNQSLKALNHPVLLYKKSENNNGHDLIVQTGLANGSFGALLTGNNKTRAVKSIIFIGTGDGTNAGSINIMMGIASVVMALEDPLMVAYERGTILNELGLSDGKLFNQPEINGTRKIKTQRNGVNYTLSISKETGFWLIAEPTNKYHIYKQDLAKLKKIEDDFFKN